MASSKRTWLWIALGIAGTLLLVVIVVVVGAIFEFRRHVHNDYVEDTVAEQEFARTRARFAGQEPLVEFSGKGRTEDAIVHRPPDNAPRAEIHTVRCLIYDFQQGHLIHVDVPGWVLRMLPRNGRYGRGFNADFGDEFDRHRVTLDDLERHGLGLVVEGRNDNTRILIWTE